MQTVKIEIDLSSDDVQSICEELNSNKIESSFLTVFLEDILKKVAIETNRMLNLAYEIKNLKAFENYEMEDSNEN